MSSAEKGTFPFHPALVRRSLDCEAFTCLYCSSVPPALLSNHLLAGLQAPARECSPQNGLRSQASDQGQPVPGLERTRARLVQGSGPTPKSSLRPTSPFHPCLAQRPWPGMKGQLPPFPFQLHLLSLPSALTKLKCPISKIRLKAAPEVGLFCMSLIVSENKHLLTYYQQTIKL